VVSKTTLITRFPNTTSVIVRIVRLCLVREKKIFGCHIGCVGLEGCRKEFSNTNKKQITEPVSKLRDESNDIN
jgi:hypothetical protein